MVYVDIFGVMDLFFNLLFVIGIIFLYLFGSRILSVSSQCSMNMNWFSLLFFERFEVLFSYVEVVIEE